jgi:hypothetical protein
MTLHDFMIEEHFEEIRKYLVSKHHYGRITDEQLIEYLNANKSRAETIKALLKDANRTVDK